VEEALPRDADGFPARRRRRLDADRFDRDEQPSGFEINDEQRAGPRRALRLDLEAELNEIDAGLRVAPGDAERRVENSVESVGRDPARRLPLTASLGGEQPELDRRGGVGRRRERERAGRR
jgi:hypothetical protein